MLLLDLIMCICLQITKKVKVLQWYELWSVDACGQNYSFLITLQEIVLEGLTGVLLKLILLSLQKLNFKNASEVDITKI